MKNKFTKQAQTALALAKAAAIDFELGYIGTASNRDLPAALGFFCTSYFISLV